MPDNIEPKPWSQEFAEAAARLENENDSLAISVDKAMQQLAGEIYANLDKQPVSGVRLVRVGHHLLRVDMISAITQSSYHSVIHCGLSTVMVTAKPEAIVQAIWGKDVTILETELK